MTSSATRVWTPITGQAARAAASAASTWGTSTWATSSGPSSAAASAGLAGAPPPAGTAPSCHGSGAEPGTTAETCPDCRGTGVVRVQQRTGGFAFSSTAPCSRCRGTGKIIHTPCKACGGSGSVKKSKRVTVSIPAGIDDGQAISLRGQGNAGKNGGPAGDLIVAVHVKPHPQFRRDGTTVLYEQPVTFYQAVMGAELEIPTIDGKVKYNLPAGTQTGTTFRLRGKGIPELRGRGRGDQYVTVRVQIPTSLNGEQKEALRAFAEAMGEDVPEESGLKGFFDKHKKRK